MLCPRSLRFSAAIIWAFLTIIAAEAEARQAITTVTANSLIARSAPQSDAVAVGTLAAGTYVVVQQVQGEWALVGWLVDKKLTSGWVSTKYLSLVSRGGGSGSSFTSSGGANFDLSVDDTDLHCREGFDGGYSSCEVTVGLISRAIQQGAPLLSAGIGILRMDRPEER